MNDDTTLSPLLLCEKIRWKFIDGWRIARCKNEESLDSALTTKQKQKVKSFAKSPIVTLF